MRRKILLLVGVGALLAAGVLAFVYWDHRYLVKAFLKTPGSRGCEQQLTRAMFDRSLELGRAFLLAHQKPAGNFDYEYDWKTLTQSQDDNEVRQAGALWGVALIAQDRLDPSLSAALERGFGFFESHARPGRNDTRCVAYPGSRQGSTGTVALLALAYVDYLRTVDRDANDPRYAQHRERLNGYLSQLAASTNGDALFHGDFDVKDCKPFGEPSPYSDGEALLALVKAAKYRGRRDLEPLIRRAADATRLHHVERALAEDADSDTTKGFYQWGSMAYYELATSGWRDTDRHGRTVLELADWMIDVHRTLKRLKNTGYAYEGIIHAYEMARIRNDEERRLKFGCAIDMGLERLLTWQVGSPYANRFASAADPQNRLALGGVQNAAAESALRIDVTQHQMHAVVLARRYVYTR